MQEIQGPTIIEDENSSTSSVDEYHVSHLSSDPRTQSALREREEQDAERRIMRGKQWKRGSTIATVIYLLLAAEIYRRTGSLLDAFVDRSFFGTGQNETLSIVVFLWLTSFPRKMLYERAAEERGVMLPQPAITVEFFRVILWSWFTVSVIMTLVDLYFSSL